jgi:hypothetical protein
MNPHPIASVRSDRVAALQLRAQESPSGLASAPIRLERAGAKPRAGQGVAANSGQLAAQRVRCSLRWLLLVGCAVPFLIAIAAVCAAIRDRATIASAVLQPVCWLTRSDRLGHPSPFDDLCGR